MSHRIIEKRRRDRMNNCLADLSRLIPADYLKKGRGRIEKTEIIEMAIKHMKFLQAHIDGYNVDSRTMSTPHRHNESDDTMSPPDSLSKERTPSSSSFTDHYRHGFHECLSETMHFLIEVEGYFAHDPFCVALVNHLRKYCDKQTDRSNMNSETRHSINGSESVMSTSSSVSSGTSGTISSNSKGINGDPGSSSSSDGGGSAVSGRSSNDDPYDGHHTSQLRDILTCPSVSSTNSISRLQLPGDSQSPSTTTINGSISSNDSNHSSTSSLYKFKNNIKQRFTAEHPERSISSASNQTSRSETDGNRSNKRRRSTDSNRPNDSDAGSSSPPPQSSVHSCGPTKYPSYQSVPIFMLHSKGAYYVPLTVDYESLAPYLIDVPLDMNLSSVVLHPVTISVNFHQQQKSLSLCSPVMSITSSVWNGQNGVNSNNFLPLQKWTSCAPD